MAQDVGDGHQLSLRSLHNIFPWITKLVDDETVTEIMVVCSRSTSLDAPPVLMFYEQAGALHQRPLDAGRRDVERLVMAVARPLGLDPSVTPLCDARLVDGSRVAMCFPPATDAPAVTIRRFARVALTPAQLVASGSLPQAVLDLMGESLAKGGNILVAGGTGSGKTTLLNALIQMFPEDHRLVVIEDTLELRVDQLNTVRLEARKLDECKLTIRDMVKHALRQRPDHIVIGEIRGAEAQDVLQALNTGHGGSLTTIHANTAKDALTRMASCAMQAEDRLPWDVLCQQVASAFTLVVNQARRPDGSRGVRQLLSVVGYDAQTATWQTEPIWSHEGDEEQERVRRLALPPVAVRTVGQRVMASPAGTSPVAAVPVDARDPSTLARPPARGFPSSSVMALWPRRHVIVDPKSSDLRPVAPPVVVGYPRGVPEALPLGTGNADTA